MSDQSILTQQISLLNFSNDFILRCSQMGFQTLQEILNVSPSELVSNEHFSYGWLGELSANLNKHGLLQLLQPLPGKNHG
jgi:hypothetical protein